MTKPRPVMERFWSKVELGPECPRLGTRCWLWTGNKSDGYGRLHVGSRGVDRRLVLVHRLSFEWAWGDLFGPWLNDFQVDHVCHVKVCVNPLHLRLVTNKQNNEHHRGSLRNSASGVRGVSWDKASNRWKAQVQHNGRSVHAGLFDSLAEAEAAAIAKRCELFTHNDLDRAV